MIGFSEHFVQSQEQDQFALLTRYNDLATYYNDDETAPRTSITTIPPRCTHAVTNLPSSQCMLHIAPLSETNKRITSFDSLILFPLTDQKKPDWGIRISSGENVSFTALTDGMTITILDRYEDQYCLLNLKNETLNIANQSGYQIKTTVTHVSPNTKEKVPNPVESITVCNEPSDFYKVIVSLPDYGIIPTQLPKDHFPAGVEGTTFYVKKVLGKGGQGTAYIVENETGNTLVAKAYNKDLDTNEPEILHYLNGKNVQNIPDIYATSDIDSHKLLFEKHFKGNTLTYERKGSEALSFSELMTIGIAKQVLYTLIQIHNQEVTHSDIKPSNIILTHNPVRIYESLIDVQNTINSYRIALIDFGSAQYGFRKLVSGELQATPGFTPPEFFLNKDNQEINPSLDLYALICTLNYCLGESSTMKYSAASRLSVLGYHPTPKNLKYLTNVSRKGLSYYQYESITNPIERAKRYTLEEAHKLRYQNAQQVLLEIEKAELMLYADFVRQYYDKTNLAFLKELKDIFAKTHPKEVGFSNDLYKSVLNQRQSIKSLLPSLIRRKIGK